MAEASIVAVERSVLSPWVTLVSRVVERSGASRQTFHSLEQSDYVSILAVTADGRVPLVRQFRPAVRRVTLELPGGLLDSKESPEAVAARELEEETGFRTLAVPKLLGTLLPDNGRLENRFWCYFALAEPFQDWRPEPGIERTLVSRADLRHAILEGSFDHAPHIALIGLAVLHGCFEWES